MMGKRAELQAMLAAVDDMAKQMKTKLRAKAREGYSGGLDPLNRETVVERLHEHTKRLTGYCDVCHSHDGDHDRDEGAAQAVDVCNLTLMLWVQGGKPPA